MQLVLHFNCSRSLFNEFPNNLHLPACTSFKTLRVMEDKVTSWVGNLVLNIMYAPLKSLSGDPYVSPCSSPPLMVSNMLQEVLIFC